MPQRRRATARNSKTASSPKLKADGLFVTDNLEGFGFSSTSNLVGAESAEMYPFFARLFESRTKKEPRYFVTPLVLESPNRASRTKLIACGSFIGATDFTGGRTGFLAFGLCFTENAILGKKRKIVDIVHKLSQIKLSDFDTRATLFDRIYDFIDAQDSIGASGQASKVHYPTDAFIHKRAAGAKETQGVIVDVIDTLLNHSGQISAVIGNFPRSQQNQLPHRPAARKEEPVYDLSEVDVFDEEVREEKSPSKALPAEKFEVTVAKLTQTQDAIEDLKFSGFEALGHSDLDRISKQLDRLKRELEKNQALASDLPISSNVLIAALFRRHRPIRKALLVVMVCVVLAVPFKLFLDYLQNAL